MYPRSLRLSPLFAFLLCLGFAALPRALAVTNDELLPENLIGKTFRFTHNAASPNSLEPAVNSYAITFNSSTTYTRTGAGLGTVNGTYSVLITFVAPNTNIRLTTLGMSNWYGTPGGAMVSLNLTHAAGIGAFAANETLNPLKNSGGLMTIDGSSPGGGGATDRPAIISGGQASATVGTPFTFQILANNVPTSYGATGLPAGLSVNPTTGLISGTPTASGSFTVALSATNALGTGTLAVGGRFVCPIAVTGGGTYTYQWYLNGLAIAGATSNPYVVAAVSSANAGTYTVRVSNASGSVTSTGGTLTLSPNASRPANISVRTNVATGAIVTPGFVIQGSGTKRVLIRAVGPGLATFNLAGTMANPKLTVFQDQTPIAENDNWSAANVGDAFAATGAFALTPGSQDAATLSLVEPGAYTIQVGGVGGTSGEALVEVYEVP